MWKSIKKIVKKSKNTRHEVNSQQCTPARVKSGFQYSHPEIERQLSNREVHFAGEDRPRSVRSNKSGFSGSQMVPLPPVSSLLSQGRDPDEEDNRSPQYATQFATGLADQSRPRPRQQMIRELPAVNVLKQCEVYEELKAITPMGSECENNPWDSKADESRLGLLGLYGWAGYAAIYPLMRSGAHMSGFVNQLACSLIYNDWNSPKSLREWTFVWQKTIAGLFSDL